MATLRVGSVTPRLVATLTVSPSSVGPQKLSLETYSVPGATTDMLPQVNQQVLDQNYFRAIDARVTSAGIVEICWANFGAGNNTVSPAASQAVSLVCF